jgi:YesN/AraC family two-component response regulator
MQRLLTRKFGFEVFLASDGIEGLSIIGQKKIDLIFTDINMPLMNGFEVVQAIKTDSKLSSIPVVILSSHNERYMISKFLQFDIIDYILKPLDLEETTERLRKVLNKYRSEIRANKRASSFSEKDDEKKTILIADKDLNFRNFFSQLYESSYQIIEAATGVNA